MGTTVQAGTSFSSVSTSKTRFSKQPAEVTQALGSIDSVTMAQGKASLRFQDLDPASRADFKATLKSLASNARLFVRDDQGSLRRADPMEIKERLDLGRPIELVSRVASENNASGNSHSHTADQERGFFTEGWTVSNSETTTQRSERVFYTTSPLTSWDSLEFASQGAGVHGVANLPRSGNSVVVSSSYENDWSCRTARQWGVFSENHTSTEATGFVRANHSAENGL